MDRVEVNLNVRGGDQRIEPSECLFGQRVGYDLPDLRQRIRWSGRQPTIRREPGRADGAGHDLHFTIAEHAHRHDADIVCGAEWRIGTLDVEIESYSGIHDAHAGHPPHVDAAIAYDHAFPEVARRREDGVNDALVPIAAGGEEAADDYEYGERLSHVLGNSFVPLQRRRKLVRRVLDVDDSAMRGSGRRRGSMQDQRAECEDGALPDETFAFDVGAM